MGFFKLTQRNGVASRYFYNQFKFLSCFSLNFVQTSSEEAESVVLAVKVIIIINYRHCQCHQNFFIVDFLTEDIKDDIRCAKVIYNRYGFKHWKGWLSRCKARPLPDLTKCSYAS